MKSRSLQDLEGMKRAVQEKLTRQKLEREEALRLERLRSAEQDLFKKAIGVVKPLASKPRVELKNEPSAPIASQQIKDDKNALRESLSDEFDVSSLLDTDDALSFRRPGIGVDGTKKLRKGDWSVQAQIDLHGLRREEARETLSELCSSDSRKRIRFSWQNPGAQIKSSILADTETRNSCLRSSQTHTRRGRCDDCLAHGKINF